MYCYVDECQDYIANDDKIADFLFKARKRRIGMVLATQDLSTISSLKVRDALMKSAIRFTATGAEMKRGFFQCFIRRMTPEPVVARLEPLPKPRPLADYEFADLKQRMWRRYCSVAKTSTREERDRQRAIQQAGPFLDAWKPFEDVVKARGAVFLKGGLDFAQLDDVFPDLRERRLMETYKDDFSWMGIVAPAVSSGRRGSSAQTACRRPPSRAAAVRRHAVQAEQAARCAASAPRASAKSARR